MEKQDYFLGLDIDDTGEKFDVRLVYLALANMLKHRGHFLLNAEGDALNTEQVDIVYQEILDSLENDYEIIIEVQKLTCSSENFNINLTIAVAITS